MNLFIRIAVDLLLIICCFVLPWWLAALLLVCGIAYFTFIELLICGIILDLLYSPGSHYIFNIPAFFTLMTVLLLFLFFYLRTRMKFY